MATPSDAELVGRARAGDQSAFGALYDTWFDRVYDLSFRVVRDANAAADVAQDSFLSAWRDLDGLSNPEAFGGWVRRIARNTALNRRRKDQRAEPVDTKAMAVIEATGPSAAGAPAGFRVEDRIDTVDDPARVAEDNEIADLVWDAADALGERDAAVLDLQLRHDLAPVEIAEVVGINRNHANQLVHRVRNRLGESLRARVLWRGGEPVCADLRAALADAGVTRFGPDAVRVATAHADDCEECSERRRLRLEPAALFSATPFLVAPAALKDRIAQALFEQGVPMDGSAHGRRGRRWRSRLRSPHAVGAAAVVAALVLLSAVLTARALSDDGDSAAARRAAATTTSTTTTTTTTQPSTQAAPGTTVGPAPTTPIVPGPSGGSVAGPGPAPPAPPPPAPVTATLSVVPSSKQSPYPNDGAAPVAQWSTSGGASVTVSGPGFSSNAPAGTSPRLCPTSSAAAWSVCNATGSYPYTLVVRDGGGAVVAQRTATLTVS